MANIKNRLFEKAARERFPIMSAFELLPVCNLECKMCYVRKKMYEVNRAGGIKPAEWWLKIAKEATECGLLYPLLTGGEPFLHPEFREILSGMLKMGLQVSINTNGTLIDKEWAEFLRDNCPTRVNITLYGASEDTYHNLCGSRVAYQNVKKAVELLKECRIPIKFNASITPHNVNDLEEMITYAKKMDAPIQVATYMFPPIRRDESMIGENDRLSPKDAGHARVKADFLQNDPRWFVAQAARYKKFVPLEQLSISNETEKMLSIRCRAGLCSAWIDWQGNLINCGMYGAAHNTLEGKSFRQAWDELVKDTAEVRYQPYCTECPNKPLCHPCIAMISNECGDLNGRPEYMCHMNQAQAYYYDEYVKKYYADVNFEDNEQLELGDDCEF